MQAPSPNIMPNTHLQQVLNYLKQGHPVLPSNPMRVPQPNLNSLAVGKLPTTDPVGM